MAGDGLLKKAENRRQTMLEPNPLPSGSAEDFAFDESSGISREDQRDILNQIEKIATSNRISSSPDVWHVKALKRGALMPMIVNIVAVILLVSGLVTLSAMFRQRESELTSGSVKLATAEGRLIQELKKEADAKLKEKDQEIAAVQDRLKALDAERGKLAATMEERIKAKENELNARLQSEVQKERERLIALGLSDATVQDRLKKFEEAKKKELEAVLDEFAKKADADRKQMEENINKMREEYKGNLAAINSERQGILDDARKREQDLRSQLDEKSKALEAERASASAGLARAQSELTRLNEQLEKSRAAEDRLVGLYGAVRDALAAGQLEEANTAVIALKSYIDDPTMAGLPAMQKRRPADVFVIDTMSKYIEAESLRSTPAAASIAQSASMLAGIRRYSTDARVALDKGDLAKAEELYGLVLSELPEIKAAADYFSAKTDKLQRDKRAGLDADLSAMRTAFISGEYQTALDRFKGALAYLPVQDKDRDVLMEHVRMSAVSITDKQRRMDETKAMSAGMDAAKRAYDAAKYDESLIAYAELIGRYPYSDQVATAIDGIRKSKDALSLASAQSGSKDVVALKTQLEGLKKDYETLSLTSKQEKAELVASRAKNDELAKQLEAAKKIEATASTATPTPSAAPMTEQDSATKAELAALSEKLAEVQRIAAKYDALAKQFALYAQAEDAILKRGNEKGVIDSRAKLDEFLSTKEAQETMPTMRDRIGRFEQAYQNAGQKEVIFNAIDMLDNLIRITNAEARLKYLDSMAKRYERDPAMLQFIDTLRTVK